MVHYGIYINFYSLLKTSVGQFDESAWQGSQLKEKHGGPADRSKAAIDLLERFGTIRGWVIQVGIFDSPLPQQGHASSKPEVYLAARLAESTMTTQQIYKKLEDLLQCMYSLLNIYSDVF